MGYGDGKTFYLKKRYGRSFGGVLARLVCTPVDVGRGVTRSVDDYEPFDTPVFRLEFDESAGRERRLKTCGYRR